MGQAQEKVEEELIARAGGSLPDDTCFGIGTIVDAVDTFAHLLERLVFGTEEDDPLAGAEAIIELTLVRRTPSMEPKPSRCARPMLVMSP